MPLDALPAVLATLKTLGDLVKATGDVKLNGIMISFQSDIMKLQSEVAKFSSDAFSLQQENQRLQIEIKQLKDAEDVKTSMEFRDNAYWKKADGDGPYCTACLDANSKLIRMLPDGNSAYAYCSTCKAPSVRVKPKYAEHPRVTIND